MVAKSPKPLILPKSTQYTARPARLPSPGLLASPVENALASPCSA
jgi:hypothetical protein